MKKSLFALAAVGAFAGVAQAQSSVTVYGLIDAGAGVSNITSGAGGANTTKQNFVGGLSSANGTGQEAGTRLGFRGTEDIGGGNRVGFTYEVGINLNNAQSSTTAPSATDNTLTNTSLFGNTRQAFASLGNTKFGELRIGTQDSLAKNLGGFFDPTKEAITTGAISLYQQGTIVRYAQAATYQAPVFAGIIFRAQYANDGSTYGNAGATQTPTSNNVWSTSARWDNGPLSIGALYESRLAATVAAGTLNSATAVAPNLATTSTYSSINQTLVAAQYNFGMITPAIMYYTQKWNNPNTPTLAGGINGIQIGATGNVSPTVQLVASYISGKVTNNNSDLYNTSGFQAQVNYALSKRSRLYGIYGQTNWSSQRTATTADVKAQQYGLGLLHTF
jgi:predicted porin